MIKVPREDICAENAAYDITKVGDIVNIRQSTGDEYVPLSFLRQCLLNCLHTGGLNVKMGWCGKYLTLSLRALTRESNQFTPHFLGLKRTAYVGLRRLRISVIRVLVLPPTSVVSYAIRVRLSLK